MAEQPIPHIVKKGDTYSSIAKKLGIKDWQKLKDYHNEHAGFNNQVGNTLYANTTLLTPTPNQVAELNGDVASKNETKNEQQQEERKQQEQKKQDEEKQQKEKTAKGEHDGKYFVVHGAKCVCDKAENPKQTADLQVTSHKIIVFNDQSGKYVATEYDKTFIPPAATFGKCTLKPSSGGNLPCQLAAAPKWNKAYESTTVQGKKTLTEISELQCMVGGKITIEKHGQTDSVSNAHADNTNPLELAMVNPAVEQPKKKQEYPSVTSISITQIENRQGFKPKNSKEDKAEFPVIFLRKGEEAKFEAKLSSGNKQLTSWVVYNDHKGAKESRILIREQIGTEFFQSFEQLGKYRIEGYGKPKSPDFEKGKYDKCDPACSIDIEVIENILYDFETNDFETPQFTRVDAHKKRKFRQNFPAEFKAKFHISPSEEEKSRLKIFTLDATGNVITDGIQNGIDFVFIPRNSSAKYTVVAEYTTEAGEKIIKQISGETESNTVVSITHSAEVIRPNTSLTFSVNKMRYSLLADGPVSNQEVSEVKWNLNGKLIGTGRIITIPGNMLLIPKKYVIEAYCKMANAFGSKAKHEEDDWHFEVKENDVVSFSLSGTPKVGKPVTAKVDKMIFPDLKGNETVRWEGLSSTITGNSIVITPRTPGILHITSKINNRKGVTKDVKVIQAAISNITFTDSQGNKIEKASWGQEINLWMEQTGLEGEKLNIVLWDYDTGSLKDPVKTITIDSYDVGLIPVTLDPAMKEKTGSHGLIFVKVTAPELIAIGEGKDFPKTYKLDVQDKREIYSAILGSADGKEKHTIVDYDEISYFYAHTRGIKPSENLYLEIRDSVFGRDPLLLYARNVKVDKSGVICEKIIWNNIRNKVNLLTVYAMVKEKNADGKVLYDADGDLGMAAAKLQKGSSLAKQAGYTGAVRVGSEQLPQQSQDGICECEARVRAYMRMLRVGEGTGELIKSSKYNKETKKNEVVYINHDFEGGYTTLFGGDNFTKSPHNKDMSSHPQIKVLWYTKKNGEKVYSSAAGAYQVMGYTWSDKGMIDKRKTYNIKDFSPEGQDKFCVVLFKHKRAGMLDLIIKGDIKGATEKYGSYEWASLPPGQYGQPIETMEKALELYNQFYKEELAGKSPLHLKKGFLKELGENCCGESTSKPSTGESSCGKSEIDLRDKIKWQTQFDPKWGARDRQLVACKKTCDDILINSGLKATSLLNLYQTAIENDDHTKLIINYQVSKEAIGYLDSELEKGHPVQVGVDHGLGYKINNNADHSTDHFVVIIGRKCDGNKCYYLFYDVGTSHKEKGASDNNRLYFDKTDFSLKGTTVYNGHLYTVTQVRKN